MSSDSSSNTTDSSSSSSSSSSSTDSNSFQSQSRTESFSSFPSGVFPTDSTTSRPPPPSRTRKSSTLTSPTESATHGLNHRPPDFVLHTISTNISIFEYAIPTDTPLRDYVPQYSALPDGSLVTSVYQEDLQASYTRLFGTSALLMLFTVNLLVAIAFIRRAHVKDKTLFYLFFASQLMGPLCFASLLAPFLMPSANCTTVNIISVISMELSYSLLLAAILGLKAYRCLYRSKAVLAVLGFMQLLIFGLFSLDMRNVKSFRLLSGSCSTGSKIQYIPIALFFTTLQSFFLCICFLYAFWKSALRPVAQGRVSIAFSVAPAPASENHAMNAPDEARRGWWDYVPRAPSEVSDASSSIHAAPLSPTGSGKIMMQRIRDSVLRITSPTTASAPYAPFGRKPSIHSETPLAHPRPPQAQMMELKPSRASRPEQAAFGRASSVRPSLHPSTSSTSLISPLQNLSQDKSQEPYEESSAEKELGMVQMRAVIMSELVSSAIITASNIGATAYVWISADKRDMVFGPSVLLGVNWAFISLVIMRSFAAVLERHEKEALMQQFPSDGGFGDSASLARHRRNALAELHPYGASSVNMSTIHSMEDDLGPNRAANRSATLRRLAGSGSSLEAGEGGKASMQRSRSSFGSSVVYGVGRRRGDTPDDVASIRRREGLKEWAKEKEARRAAGTTDGSSSASHDHIFVRPPPPPDGNPFADSTEDLELGTGPRRSDSLSTNAVVPTPARRPRSIMKRVSEFDGAQPQRKPSAKRTNTVEFSDDHHSMVYGKLPA